MNEYEICEISLPLLNERLNAFEGVNGKKRTLRTDSK